MAFYAEVIMDVPEERRKTFDACVSAKTSDGYDVGKSFTVN